MPLSSDEVRSRATGGAALLIGRGALVLGFGLVANLVLARLLEPRDFGLVAIGSVLVVLGGYLASGGLGAALVRRPEPPTHHELSAVDGLQIALTVAITAVAVAAAVPVGRDGYVIAVMVATLPITILRAPATIVLERNLSYRTIATVDVLEAVAFYVWAIAAVALGAGVWGMATAMVVRAVVGTGAMARLGPLGLVRPCWSWATVRPLLGFGAKLQAITLIQLVREQGINIATAAIGGVATLGTWNLAYRVLQAPQLMFNTAARVSYPAMSRLLEDGRDPRRTIERGVANLTVATAVVLVAIVGFAPALPALIGDAWHELPETLAAACAAIIVSAPVYVAAVGYLYAADRAGAVVWAMVAYTVVWLGVGLPLVTELGAVAIGLGWIAGSVASSAVLARATARATGASIVASVLLPAALGALGGALGWAVATAGGSTVVDGLLGAATGEAALLLGLALLRRALLRDAWRLLGEAVRGAIAPR